jgi:calcineurin-like phosphoesterase family protein
MQMNTTIIDNHNVVVNPGDGVVFLGDLAFTNDAQANIMLDSMNGDKYLVIGNHDLHHKKLKKYNVIAEHLMLILERKDYTILFTHFPIEELPEQDFNRNPLFNVHGHTHDADSCSPRHINVSVEKTNYTPINLTEIEKMVYSRQLEIIG